MVIGVALPVIVFVAMVAAVVILVMLVNTVVMVAVGDGRRVVQNLLLEGGDLPPQQLFQRGGVRSRRVMRLKKHVGEDFKICSLGHQRLCYVKLET